LARVDSDPTHLYEFTNGDGQGHQNRLSHPTASYITLGKGGVYRWEVFGVIVHAGESAILLYF